MKAGNWEKAKTFLEMYKNYLPILDRENFYKYSLAILNLRQGNADRAMILLQEIQLKEPLYNLDARRHLARIYFDKKEYTALESLTISSKNYLKRQHSIGYQKDMYENFFLFIAKIMKIDFSDTAKITALKTEIFETELVAEKKWLLDILEK